jgi:hypothetical protein
VGVLPDLNALHRELHQAGRQALTRTLAALEPSDRATLATHLVHNFTDQQLTGLGRDGLHVVRRAMCADAAERCEHAVERVDAALRRLPRITATPCEDVWVLSEGPVPGPVTPHAAPGTVVILVHGHTDSSGLCDYYRQCFEELPEPVVAALNRGQVSFLPIEQIRVPLWARLRSFALRVAWA